ncbi:hypothetical protein EVAR_18755_1 [Eumeta japonica]|uniref:Uncharacterized protein n=1 Tax=Eumeta variegata TaxID=151549 RepID=A0A4C1UN06_EUMVA|nr:hypothetical protein EVAR_18755_1 [Eumeta japonica]
MSVTWKPDAIGFEPDHERYIPNAFLTKPLASCPGDHAKPSTAIIAIAIRESSAERARVASSSSCNRKDRDRLRITSETSEGVLRYAANYSLNVLYYLLEVRVHLILPMRFRRSESSSKSLKEWRKSAGAPAQPSHSI